MSDLPTAANRLKSMALGERPQERLEKFGVAALSDTELLAMLLRNGTRSMDVVTLASSLVREAGTLTGLLAWPESSFRRLKGIGRVKAFQLVTVMEVARRILRESAVREEAPILTTGSAIFAHCQPFAAGLEVEKFWALLLNRKNRLLKLVEVTSGTLHSSLVHPREVFREAIREAASGIICVHNHPSGDPLPSSADIKVTQQLRDAARTVQIDLLDHVIIGRLSADPLGRGYYSFRDAGMI